MLIDAAEKVEGKLARYHKVTLEANRPYTIEAEAEQFNCKVVLFDPAGTKVAAENRAFLFDNRRVARIDFTPHATATYVIGVMSTRAQDTGAYTLRVQGYGPAPAKK